MIPAGSLLLVDDEELNRDMLGRRLEFHGYAVTSVESGRDALALLGQQSFELVLLDVMMPEMNGLQVLQHIRAEHTAAELPVIMVTAKTQSEDLVEAFQLGANDYITKPVDMPIALARISTQLSLKRAQAALRESETRYALAAQGANDGLWDWNLLRNEMYFSPRWKAMLGYKDDEIGSSPDDWFARIHPDDVSRVHADLVAHQEGKTVGYENEHRILHRDGNYRWMLSRAAAVRNKDGRAVRMAGSQTDISAGTVADALTGLPNRVLFVDRLERAIERAKRNRDYIFAVFFLDLDRFKIINDSLGHLIGDQLLIGIARRLEECLRSCDTVARLETDNTVARLGGDEFTILLDGIANVADVSLVAERLVKELSMPFNLNGNEVFTSASVGIALGGS
ncbi:MAG: diguanylate cyclase domain-containing protein, partial [Gemmataceae bacterium]